MYTRAAAPSHPITMRMAKSPPSLPRLPLLPHVTIDTAAPTSTLSFNRVPSAERREERRRRRERRHRKKQKGQQLQQQQQHIQPERHKQKQNQKQAHKQKQKLNGTVREQPAEEEMKKTSIPSDSHNDECTDAIDPTFFYPPISPSMSKRAQRLHEMTRSTHVDKERLIPAPGCRTLYDLLQHQIAIGMMTSHQAFHNHQIRRCADGERSQRSFDFGQPHIVTIDPAETRRAQRELDREAAEMEREDYGVGIEQVDEGIEGNEDPKHRSDESDVSYIPGFSSTALSSNMPDCSSSTFSCTGTSVPVVDQVPSSDHPSSSSIVTSPIRPPPNRVQHTVGTDTCVDEPADVDVDVDVDADADADAGGNGNGGSSLSPLQAVTKRRGRKRRRSMLDEDDDEEEEEMQTEAQVNEDGGGIDDGNVEKECHRLDSGNNKARSKGQQSLPPILAQPQPPCRSQSPSVSSMDATSTPNHPSDTTAVHVAVADVGGRAATSSSRSTHHASILRRHHPHHLLAQPPRAQKRACVRRPRTHRRLSLPSSSSDDFLSSSSEGSPGYMGIRTATATATHHSQAQVQARGSGNSNRLRESIQRQMGIRTNGRGSRMGTSTKPPAKPKPKRNSNPKNSVVNQHAHVHVHVQGTKRVMLQQPHQSPHVPARPRLPLSIVGSAADPTRSGVTSNASASTCASVRDDHAVARACTVSDVIVISD